MNQCNFIGRLTTDPEFRTTPQGTPVASFTLAVDREFSKDATDFIRVIAWRNTAEFCAKNLHKGERIGLSGSLQSRQYEDNDTGKKRTVHEIKAKSVYFADSKRSGYTAGSAAAGAIESGDFYPEDDDEGGLPF